MGSGDRAILTYHSLDRSGSVISTDPALFRRQMEWLAASGIPVVPLAALPQTPRSIALTFDDGFRSFATHAAPVLEEFRLPATLFVVSGYCGRTNRWPGQSSAVPEFPLLEWRELRELSERGIALGAHTVNHPRLPALAAPDAESEIRDSQAAIEDRTGARVDTFAYPYGTVRPWVRDLVRQRFVAGCGTRLRFISDRGSDPAELPRIDAYYLQHRFWYERLMGRAGHGYVWARRLCRELRACLSPSS